MVQPARARHRSTAGDDAGAPRRTVDRLAEGLGRGGRRHPEAARSASAAPAGRSTVALAAELDEECEWLVTNGVLPADLVTHNRQVAEAALRPWTPAFTHGDLQIAHVFLDGDEVTGIIDWSEAGQGDPLYDLATFTLGHEEHLDDVIAGYGTDIDLDVIHAWWSLRSLLAVRWLIEHGFDPFAPGCEVDVLRARM
ncbi:aminoglycoside phosphotransferase family protein [Streptomyces sp. SS52]|nr:phosphotransferase [Streptomyces sp. SS52]QCB20725.1 aminoglycoside phosphotransferase family protein [Streptomyces sp. SS52]